MEQRHDPTTRIPAISNSAVAGFLWFVRRYLRQHFHSFAVNRHNLGELTFTEHDSLVVYANHASWWDPIAALYLAKKSFPIHQVYAPIDAQALTKYQMFAKMGFYAVDQSSLRGAANFLRTSSAILQRPASSIWITPEGRFVDPRDTSAELAGGLAHLAARISAAAASSPTAQRRTWFVPGAAEYAFWEERKPELLCWFGRPVCVTEPGCEQLLGGAPRSDKAAWQALLTERLRTAQRELATASIARDSSQFQILLGGKSGSFFVYDWWRGFKSRLRGTRLNTDHSDKLRSPPK